MARDLIEHVIEERDAGRDLGAAAAVEVHCDDDRRFLGGTLDAGTAPGRSGCGGLPVVHRLSSFKAASSKSFSSVVPTVIRKQLASSGCQP